MHSVFKLLLAIQTAARNVTTTGTNCHGHLPQEFPWNHLVAGATAGAISRTATAPLELVRLQAMTGTATTKVQHVVGSAKAAQRPRLVDSLKAACAKDGWPGLWRGNGINVLRAVPQKAIDFFAFAVYKDSHMFTTL